MNAPASINLDELAAISLVALAVGYLTARVVQLWRKKGASGCGACPACPADADGELDGKDLIALDQVKRSAMSLKQAGPA